MYEFLSQLILAIQGCIRNPEQRIFSAQWDAEGSSSSRHRYADNFVATIGSEMSLVGKIIYRDRGE